MNSKTWKFVIKIRAHIGRVNEVVKWNFNETVAWMDRFHLQWAVCSVRLNFIEGKQDVDPQNGIRGRWVVQQEGSRTGAGVSRDVGGAAAEGDWAFK